ncbi:hypothetical protein ACFB49_31890 [Sphingomonas sp. DBB INV C78]|uniref:hypothetical protein n=1 Tax=Sphingomonas sp. DBB INV C78 TaxID=3349434 RepID=UPI0036D2995C
MPTEPHPLAAPQVTRATLRIGDKFLMEAETRTTPLGLLAIGGLVAAILLSVPPIVRAKRARRLASVDPAFPADGVPSARLLIEDSSGAPENCG